MPLFAYVDPPDVSIIPEYFGTRNHIPRETATVTLSKPMGPACITVLRKICLNKRLKMGKLSGQLRLKR